LVIYSGRQFRGFLVPVSGIPGMSTDLKAKDTAGLSPLFSEIQDTQVKS
jgi:hypothetical protein